MVLEEYGPWVSFDLRPHVRTGSNELQLRCRPSGPAASIAAGVRVTGADGKSTEFSSDETWAARTVASIDAPKDTDSQTETKAVALGAVPRYLWDAGDRSIEITPFDDYEQWKRALGSSASEPDQFQLPPGFEIEKLRSAGEGEGSWVSLEFDPQGRLLVAMEEQGLLRIVLSEHGSIENVAAVEAAADLEEIRGLAFLSDDLYVNANNSKGCYRLRDTDGDGEFDETELVREFPGGVGHGRNDLAVHDGAIDSIHGDAVDLPTEGVTDLTSPRAERPAGEEDVRGASTAVRTGGG